MDTFRADKQSGYTLSLLFPVIVRCVLHLWILDCSFCRTLSLFHPHVWSLCFRKRVKWALYLLWNPKPILSCINELGGCGTALHQTALQLALDTPVWGQTAWARTTSFYFSKETRGMFWTLQKPFPPTFKPQSTVAGQWGCQLCWIRPVCFGLCLHLFSFFSSFLFALILSERTFRPQCNVVYCGEWGGCFVWSKKIPLTPPIPTL